MTGGLHPGGIYIQGGGLHRGGGEAGQNPSDTWDTAGCGQQAGGMHPTGMLSCFAGFSNPGG